jgi:hypothetical protein
MSAALQSYYLQQLLPKQPAIRECKAPNNPDGRWQQAGVDRGEGWTLLVTNDGFVSVCSRRVYQVLTYSRDLRIP